MTTGPLAQLTGMKTADGWTIGEVVQQASYQTGGNFSVGFVVKHDDGRDGFLKALDFSRAAAQRDTVRALQLATACYNFERDVLDLCRGARLSRIVVALSNGEIPLPGAPFDRVFYLIFELASGDVRKRAVLTNAFDLGWTVRALHHIATGVSQLHSRDIYHQDLKPSNVLVFGEHEESKLADLGRAHCAALGAPHDHLVIAGARSYAPPEQLYNFMLPDQDQMRASADLYLLGSLIYFMFMGAMLTPAIVDRLRDEHIPGSFSKNDSGWAGTFDDVLPYLRNAFASVLQEFSHQVVGRFNSSNLRIDGEEIVALFTYLCELDPRQRGHPSARSQKYSNVYALDRFISALDRISNHCERVALA